MWATNDNMERVCNDKTAWVRYTGDDGDLCVYARCFCGRYLKHGKVTLGMKFTGWTCSKCGEVEPFHLID